MLTLFPPTKTQQQQKIFSIPILIYSLRVCLVTLFSARSVVWLLFFPSVLRSSVLSQSFCVVVYRLITNKKVENALDVQTLSIMRVTTERKTLFLKQRERKKKKDHIYKLHSERSGSRKQNKTNQLHYHRMCIPYSKRQFFVYFQ